MRRLLFTYFTVTMILASGCVKEIDTFQPIELTSGNIDRFFEAVQSNPIQASWDASQERNIQLPGSSRVIVPANALVNADGIPASGEVQAEILPIFDKGQLLTNRISTIANDQVVKSAGIVHIEITQDGQPLFLKEDKTLTIQLTTARYNSQMRLFTGDVNENGFVEWSLVNLEDNPINSRDIENGEGEDIPGFEFFASQLGYLKVGVFIDSEDTGEGEVCLNLPHSFVPGNTVAFVVMKDYDGVIAIPPTDGPRLPDLCRMGLPKAAAAEVIVISEEEEGQYFYAQEPITISENLTIKIQPARAALSEIMLALEGL
jgi:hypothetical protein